MVAKDSPQSFHELRINYEDYSCSVLFSEGLESFFINWMNRTSQRSLSFIINSYFGSKWSIATAAVDNVRIIQKYIKLGVIKRFDVM